MQALAFSPSLPSCSAARSVRPSRPQHCSRSLSSGGPRVCLPGRRNAHLQLTTTAVAALDDAPLEVQISPEDTEQLTGDMSLDTKALYAKFESLLEKYDYNFKKGDKVVGTIFRVDQKGALVDIGAKGAAYISVEEISINKPDRATQVLEADTRREFVITRDNANGEIQLSLRELEYAVAWQRIRQLQEEDVTVIGEVVGSNNGGVTVKVQHLNGFVPSSHLATSVKKEDLLGQELPLKILEADEEQFRLVFSNRRAVGNTSMNNYKVGDVVVGVVQAVKPYGAFIDIGGANGLLHISQISHDRIASVEAILSEGDKLKVMILTQDRDRNRVSLSTKKLEPTPGDMLRDPALVYARAEQTAAEFKQRMAPAEQQPAEVPAEAEPEGAAV